MVNPANIPTAPRSRQRPWAGACWLSKMIGGCRNAPRTIRDMGFEIQTVSTAETGMRLLEEKAIDILIVDLNLPGIGGMDMLELVHRRWPDIQPIVLTGFGDLQSASAVPAWTRSIFSPSLAHWAILKFRWSVRGSVAWGRCRKCPCFPISRPKSRAAPARPAPASRRVSPRCRSKKWKSTHPGDAGQEQRQPHAHRPGTGDQFAKAFYRLGQYQAGVGYVHEFVSRKEQKWRVACCMLHVGNLNNTRHATRNMHPFIPVSPASALKDSLLAST